MRWPRAVPRDADCATKLNARTRANFYNRRERRACSRFLPPDGSWWGFSSWCPGRRSFGSTMAEALISAKARRLRVVRKHPRPFIAKVHGDGRVTI